jgi:hypothetical protein
MPSTAVIMMQVSSIMVQYMPNCRNERLRAQDMQRAQDVERAQDVHQTFGGEIFTNKGTASQPREQEEQNKRRGEQGSPEGMRQP